MTIAWSSAYETGEKRVDNQHKHLFEYVGTLGQVIEGVRAGQPIVKTDIDGLLIFLDTYVNVHFAYEELCMTIRRCPMAKKNVDAHNKLIEFYGDFCAKAEEGVTLEMLETLHTALSNWLVNHICKVDINIRDHDQPRRTDVNCATPPQN